jgi:hypothetical protein
MDMGAISIIHPVIASAVVILCFANAYLGISRFMLVKGVRSRFVKFNRGLHIKLGRSFMGLLYLAYPLGIIGITTLGASPFSTPHVYLATLLLLVFSAGAFLAFQILKGKQNLIKYHGTVMVLGALLLLVQIRLGIDNLMYLGLI